MLKELWLEACPILSPLKTAAVLFGESCVTRPLRRRCVVRHKPTLAPPVAQQRPDLAPPSLLGGRLDVSIDPRRLRAPSGAAKGEATISPGPGAGRGAGIGGGAPMRGGRPSPSVSPAPPSTRIKIASAPPPRRTGPKGRRGLVGVARTPPIADCCLGEPSGNVAALQPRTRVEHPPLV